MRFLSSTKSVCILLAILFLVLITLSNILFKNMRLDLTENKIYSLSDSTRNIVAAIDQPLNLYLFFTQESSSNNPYYRKYYKRVREILEEYKIYAGGKLRLNFIDPVPFSEDEDRASGFGIQRIPLEESGDVLYFGLAGSNAVGDVEKIPFLDPRREVFLEYDIDKLLYTLMNPKKPIIGLMSALPMYPVEGLGAASRPNPWVIIEQIEQLFEVQLVFTDSEQIDEEIDVLMVVHPKNLADKTLYAIDQYVMKGGNAIFFVDPYAEVEEIPLPSDVQMQDLSIKGSSLNTLFKEWGFEVAERTVVTDFNNSLQISLPGQPPQRNILYIGLNKNSIDREDVVTSALEQVNFAIASHIKVLDKEKIEMTPLMYTSKESSLVPLDIIRFMSEPSELEKGFRASQEEYPIAARLKGEIDSAFDAPPKEADEEGDNGDDSKSDDADGQQAQDDALDSHIAKSDGPVNLLVVADVDVLSDRLWVVVQNFFGQRLYQPIANNRDFVINAIDNITGGKDLIGIRSRASFNRPFTKVVEIEQGAVIKYREVEQELESKLRETEAKLQELQEQRSDRKRGANILSDEQMQEYQKFQRQRLQTRKQLREVKYNLAKDIDQLGRDLKIINIGAVPALVTVLALVFAFVKRRRQRR
ncbi:MAG: Gldg family protein [Chromatiales bacterium]|nr:Gldg family protein [Chromatiales bacterium]